MFVIEGMDKVRKVIEENRNRKLTKHKKISNNTVIEIDHCSPLEILKLQKNLVARIFRRGAFLRKITFFRFFLRLGIMVTYLSCTMEFAPVALSSSILLYSLRYL